MDIRKEYVKGMERLIEIVPKKKLSKHLITWLSEGLTTEQKLFEVRLLLVVWDK